MSQPTLFIADVHLQPENSHPINRVFLTFLEQHATHADALYILGDLFEMWVGDDIGLVQYATVIEALSRLTSSGVAVYLLFGNRDFLMRKRFWERTGIQPIQEPYLLECHGQTMLLMHGDSLCTDDREYQKMRRILRHPLTTWLFLRLSKRRRLRIGQHLREQSKQRNQNKAENIMDVNQDAITRLLNRYPQATHLIHGHTHRAGHHIHFLDNKPKHRWVVGDWRPQTRILSLSSTGVLSLMDYPEP
jgi:UDP-2,3-diacylglucosamine hydrolase